MFEFIRVIFLTLITAYRPVLARPHVLSGLVVVPVLIATLLILGAVPFAQRAILLPLDLQHLQGLTAGEQLTHRLLMFVAEMLALVPWLWLASVLMMNWPKFRHSAGTGQNPRLMIMHRRIWISTAFMISACLLVALPLATLLLWSYYHATMTETGSITIKGSVADSVLFFALVLLSLYGLVFHGLSNGIQISMQESRRRLKGRRLRLFFTILLIVGAAYQVYAPIASDAGWGGSPLRLLSADAPGAADHPLYDVGFGFIGRSWGGSPIQLLNSDVPGPLTNAFFVFRGGYVVDVFVFALVICAISEIIARAYSATRTEAAEPQSHRAPANA